MIQNISSGVVHELPADVKEMLLSNPECLAIWEAITPLARNEWLCWIASAKKLETRDKRIELCHTNLMNGKKRPCCWLGCPHR